MTRKARLLKTRLAAATLIVGALIADLQQSSAQPALATSSRLALVIGEAGYRNGPLSSAANDAGLIADTLQKAGFDVTGAADLDQEGLRRTLREFVEKAATAGPEAMVFIYLAGRGVQYEGENYLAPIDAAIPAAANVPLEAVRLSDYLKPLAQMPLKARVIVLDAARINAFAQTGAPLAGGLALVEPEAGALFAFNAAPGAVAPAETGPYGVYAQALTEMMREGGLPLDAAFARTRLRVSEQTKGAQIPWSESKLSPAPALFARAPGAPPPQVAFETQANMRARPIRDFPVDQAYGAVLEQDTLAGYTEFLNAYPNSAYAERVRAMLALRREAVTWRRAWLANTPNAYWTYLQYYPRGPHAEDARRRLGMLNVALMPPPRFDAYNFDVPPPADAEEVYFNRPYVVFDDPAWGAPPPMNYLLAPRPYQVERAPPPPPYAGLLPLPLLAAPLLFAIPAVRQGLFHAPAVITTQQPAANAYYSGHYARPPGATPGAIPGAPGAIPGAPGAIPGAPAAIPGAPGAIPGAPGAIPAAPGAPGGALAPHGPQGQNGAPAAGKPLPHPAIAPGGAPLPQGQQVPNAAPPNGAPLPHPAAAPGAPVVAPPAGTPLPHVPNAAPPVGAPLPHPVAPGAPVVAPPAGTAPPHAPNAAPPTGAPLPHPAAAPGAPVVAPPAGAAPPHVPHAPGAAPAIRTPPPAAHAPPHPAAAPAAPALAPRPPAPAPAPHVNAPRPPQEAPHAQPPRPVAPVAPPIARPVAPPIARPVAPPVARPIAPPAPHIAAPPQQPHPHCGAPGEPPCH